MSFIAFLSLFWKALVSAFVIIISVVLAKKHPDSADLSRLIIWSNIAILTSFGVIMTAYGMITKML